MSSHTHLQSGFSLIELLIAIALFGVVATVVVDQGRAWYQRAVLQSNTVALVTTLFRARAEALFEKSDSSHSVAVSGNTYSINTEPMQFDPGIDGGNVAIGFNQASAVVAVPATVTLQAADAVRSVEVTSEGLVLW